MNLSTIKSNFSQKKLFIYFFKFYEFFRFLFYLILIRLMVSCVLRLFGWGNDPITERVYDLLSSVMFLLFFFKKKIRQFSFKSLYNFVYSYKKLIFYGFLMSIVTNTIVSIFSYIPLFTEYMNTLIVESKNNIEGTNAMLLLINNILLMPLIEEIIFRGNIYSSLCQNTSKKKSAIITSLFFGLLHYTNILWGILAFIFSLALCKVYDKDKLPGSIFFHMGFNLLTLFNFLLNDALDGVLYKNTVFNIIYLIYFVISIFFVVFLIKQYNKQKEI